MSLRRMNLFLVLVGALGGSAACSARGGGGGPIVEVDAGDDTGDPADADPPVDTPESPPDVGPTCAPPRVSCSGACVDVAADVNNCGGCGRRCSTGASCASGACVDAPPACAAPRMTCGGACVDPQTDVANCGACGRRCTAGQSCAAGACRTGAPTCTGTQVSCGGVCVDVTTNAANCGLCGFACSAGQTCVGGNCTGGSTCAAPRRMCGTACTDVTSDAANCGACGVRCAAGQACSASACRAGTPSSAAGAPCTDDSTCGVFMCNPDFFPNGGVCTQECTQGTATSEQSMCGGATSTCLRVPAQNRKTMEEVDASLCVQACGTSSAACRAGYACTNLWYGYGAASTFTADTRPGCFPWCTADAHCPSGMRCNTHSGVCGATGAPATLRRDGDPCDPTLPTTTRQCRGFCVRVSMDVRTQGICGTLYPQNAGGTATCPDDRGTGTDYPFLSAMAFGVTPVAGEQVGVCIYRSCATNADCTAPLVCGDQMVCEYPL